MSGSNPSAKKVAKTAVDMLLAADLVAVMATALVEEVPHEYLGVALFVLMVAHIVLNRRYFTHLAKGRYTPLRVLQLLAVIGLIACVIGQVASALVLSKHAFAFLPAIPGAAWARTVHMLFSYWCFIFAFAHVGLQVKAKLPVWLQVPLIAVACFGAVSFVQLDMAAYLFGQVMFAAADYASPLALIFARYASVAILVAVVFHYIRIALQRAGKAR